MPGKAETHSWPKVFAKNCRPSRWFKACGLGLGIFHWPKKPIITWNFGSTLYLLFSHMIKKGLVYTLNGWGAKKHISICKCRTLTCCRFKLFMGQLVGSKATEKQGRLSSWVSSLLICFAFRTDSHKNFPFNPNRVVEIWTWVFCELELELGSSGMHFYITTFLHCKCQWCQLEYGNKLPMPRDAR